MNTWNQCFERKSFRIYGSRFLSLTDDALLGIELSVYFYTDLADTCITAGKDKNIE